MSPIHFNSERERKAYQDGLAIVAAKLVGNRRMTPEGRHQYSMAVGLATVATIKKMSALLKAGLPPAPAPAKAPAAKPAPATPARFKTYAPPAAPRQLTRHCYTTRGIFA